MGIGLGYHGRHRPANTLPRRHGILGAVNRSSGRRPKHRPHRDAAARAIDEFLRALGHEPTGELAETGKLVAAAWCDELLRGYALDPAALLREGSLPAGSARGLVLLRGLDAATMCPHHLLPSHGSADVAYLPGDRVAGFGAIARALEACTRRLVLQEQAGQSLADLLVSELGARGALVRLTLAHTCLALRGAEHPTSRVDTIALAGSCAAPGADRDAAFAALGAAPSTSTGANT
jgi:GTP cyclohydrolase IA